MIPAFIRASAVCAGVIALSACSDLSGLGGSSQFHCAAPQGVPCMSVSGVAANDTAGTLPGLQVSATPASDTGATSRPMPADTGAARLMPAVARDSAEPLGAIRSEPTVIRIWVAPWEDADGDLNDQSYVYLQIDAGRWLIEHNRARIQQAFAPRPAEAATTAEAPASTPTAQPNAAQRPAAQLLHLPQAIAGAGMTRAAQQK